MTHNRLPLALLCASGAFVLLSGCGGGTGTSAMPARAQAPAPPGASPSSGMNANAMLVITIPAKASANASSRKPAYVSPSTQSITVQVDSGTPVMENLTPGSPNCSVPAPLAPLTCTVPIAASAGAHTLTFTTYDQTGAAGNVLSTNSVTQTLAANQVNTIDVTLAGVPKWLLVAPLYNAVGIGGTQASGFMYFFGVPQTLSVTALDADDNLIVGPGAPALSVSVTGATPGSGITAAPASNGNPNDITLQSTSVGIGTLAITATPASGLAGSAVTLNIPLSTTAKTTTLAGSEANLGYGLLDGTGSAAKFRTVSGIAYDSADGNLYITDTQNCVIRQMTPAGAVQTIAGAYPSMSCAFADGTGTSAHFYNPAGIAYDSADGNLYVTDIGDCRIRRVTTAGVVSTFAGGACGNADGAGAAAQFNAPEGIAYDAANGDLYVTDTANCEIRRITSGGVVSTIAGSVASCNTGVPNSVDGTGSAAQFQRPEYLTYDSADGDLYVTDYGNCEVRRVTTAGVVTTLAGSSANCPGNMSDGTGSAAQFSYFAGITYDSADGNLYVTNAGIRQVTPAGVVTTLKLPTWAQAPNCSYLVSGAVCVDGLSNSAWYNVPTGLVFDPATGYLYVTDYNFHAIRQVQL